MDLFQLAGRLLTEYGPLVSWLITIGGTALFFVPAAGAFFIFRKKPRALRLALIGIAFGMVAWPFSFWLYLHYYVDVFRKFLLGYPGVYLVGFHCTPLRIFNVHMGDPTGPPPLWPGILVGAFWAVIYGAAGFGIGWKWKKPKAP
ncbi:MAG: hypothetical protein AB1405_11460 [Bdellovibrionota bacterium]